MFNFLYGFLILLGINQVILTPCIILHTSFTISFWLSTVVDLLLVGFSYCIEKPTNKNIFRILHKFNRDSIITILMCVLVLSQIVLTTITYKSNADDSFYVSLSTSSIDSESIYIQEPSMGLESEKTALLATELLPSIELQISIWSKISTINPTIICHSLLPIIVIFVAYLSFYYFANNFLDEKNSKIFLIIISIVFLFTGFHTRFRPGYLLGRSWQGKSIFLNIGLTMIISLLIKMDKDINKENMILLIISNLASLALSSTSVFLIPFTYIAFGVLKLIKLKWKEILYLIITFIPVIVYVAIYFWLNKIAENTFYAPQGDVNIIKELSKYKSNTYLIYYLISTIIIMFIGSKEAKKYFGQVQIINALTIWNPIFSNFIAKYFTSSATFWRVLWIMPIEFSIGYCVVKIIEKLQDKKMKIIAFGITIVILIIPGKFIYSFVFIENLENIPQYIVDQTNYILEQNKEKDKIVVLAPPEPLHSVMMRQMTSKIELVQSRDTYIGKIKNREEQIERYNLGAIYNNIYKYSTEQFEKILKKYDVDWIIIDKNNTQLKEYIEETCMEKECEIEGYILYNKK